MIAANTPLTNFAITNALRRISDMGAEQGLFTESLIAAITAEDPTAKERVKAFLEKRAPRFTGA